MASLGLEAGRAGAGAGAGRSGEGERTKRTGRDPGRAPLERGDKTRGGDDWETEAEEGDRRYSWAQTGELEAGEGQERGLPGRLLPGTTPSLYQPSPILGSRLSAEANYFEDLYPFILLPVLWVLCLVGLPWLLSW